MIEALEADLVYRQRRHAEGAKLLSTFWKVVIGVMTLLVGGSTIGTFLLLVTRHP